MPADEPTNQPETLSDRLKRSVREHLRESPVKDNPLALQLDEDAEQPENDSPIEPTATGREGVLKHSSTSRTGGLTALASAAALVVGLWMHSHFGSVRQICESGVGALGQTFSTTAQKDCTLDSFLTEAGLWVAIASGFILIAAVVTLIAKRQQREAGTGGW